jgi:acetate kinase
LNNESILIINTGSSSLKFGLSALRDATDALWLDGSVEGIGLPNGKLELKEANGHTLHAEKRRFTSYGDALHSALAWVKKSLGGEPPAAVAHRLVHGGPFCLDHQRLTPTVLSQLRGCVHFAPLHVPIALDLIGRIEVAYPDTPQFACFDTAFHRNMPETAARFALPHDLFDEGIRRYGFHGLSYESIVHQLDEDLPARTVMAHLGNGASLVAVKNGHSVDTTMGLTPTGGIPMQSRSGDLDPGVLLYLSRVKRMNADSLERLLNNDSGLAALSDGGDDMRNLEIAANEGSAHAQLALDMFDMAIAKVVASYGAVLGGLDMLVFTGGIGENSWRTRSQVGKRLGFLGLAIDDGANHAHDRTISTPRSQVRVCVLPSHENQQIARHCRALLSSDEPPS